MTNNVNIISSGSQGNAVIYCKKILVDCGVAYKLIEPYLKDIEIVLLTHEHGDHINLATLKKMQFEKPSLRIGCCEWMKNKVSELKNVNYYWLNVWYDYNAFQIVPGKLYHDVKNCFYRIFVNRISIFHATDTAHLIGITAKDYDIYSIECNYDEDTIFEIIKNKESRGEFAHERGSINTHLSKQKAHDFFLKNSKKDSVFISLHESKSAL